VTVLRVRVIPCLLLKDGGLVKTVRFKHPAYIGDPINTVRIFNELEVDELAFLDIGASVEGRAPDLAMLQQIADECFMPLSYGGGIRDLATAERILQIGFEKLILNSAVFDNPQLIAQLARRFGSQAVIVSIDVTRDLLGRYRLVSHSATRTHDKAPVDWAREVEQLGAGEILLTAVHREGTWQGFDVPLTARVTAAVGVPVIAHGGAGSIAHVGEAVAGGKASAVALGSLVVYQSQGMGVLVNFPDKSALARTLAGA
jgi:imidazole glycerol-phosphate synthase subunit HisF